MLVSVMPMSRAVRDPPPFGADWAIRKNHGPSGEPWMCTVWSAR